jgi:hypothetical protein
MEFRNRLGHFVESEGFSGHHESNPRLFIDLRMSLGTYQMFTLPLRDMHENVPLRVWEEAMDAYTSEYLFPQEDGLQEPCTARALVFTGAAVAAHTAALVLYMNQNLRELIAAMEDGAFKDCFFDVEGKSPFKWISSFDSLGWRDTNRPELTRTFKEMFAQTSKDLQRATEKIAELEKALSEAKPTPVAEPESEPEPQSAEPTPDLEEATSATVGGGFYHICDRVFVRGGRGAHFEITGFAFPDYYAATGLWVASGLLVGSEKTLISAERVLGKVPS